MHGHAQTIAKVELTMDLRPADPKMPLSEAKERFLALHPENRIHDFGDKKDVVLRGAHDKSKLVAYEFIPELSPPGFTIQMAMEHMKRAGYDVRGISPNGKHIMVSEQEIKS